MYFTDTDTESDNMDNGPATGQFQVTVFFRFCYVLLVRSGKLEKNGQNRLLHLSELMNFYIIILHTALFQVCNDLYHVYCLYKT